MNNSSIAALQELQKEYCLCSFNSQIKVGRLKEIEEIKKGKRKEDINAYSRADGKLLMQRYLEQLPYSIKTEEIINEFFISPQTTNYNEVIFSPTACNKETLNYWVPPKPKAVKGSTSIIGSFLREVICDNDLDLFTYLTRFLAHMVQKPSEKPGVMLILLGGQGIGKGTFFNLIQKIWDGSTLLVSDVEHVIGGFNGALERNFVVCMDEAIFSGQKKAIERLKSFVTEPMIQIEKKYVPRQEIRSLHRFIASSNQKHFGNVDLDDRRFLFFRVSEKYKEDTAYWNNLYDALNDKKKLEAVFYRLKNTDLSNFNVRKKPITKELFSQKLKSLSGFGRYWYEVLNLGYLDIGSNSSPYIKFDESFIDSQKLIFYYDDFYKRTRQYNPRQFSEVREGLSEWCPSAKHTRKKIDGDHKRGYQLPNILDARKDFESNIGSKISWN